MTAQEHSIRFTPRHEDESWSPSWSPRRTGDGAAVSWEDLPEAEFLAYRFRADPQLTIAGRDFSTTYAALVDFALAWSWVPEGLELEPRVESALSTEALEYTFQRRGEQGELVRISSSSHPDTVTIDRADLAGLVDQIVTSAFDLLFSAHPQLRENRYLLDVRHRIGRG